MLGAAAMSRVHQVVILTGAIALGIASSDSDAQQLVKATLLSNAIRLDTSQVKPGVVTLVVHNAADNDMVHELVVLKTDAADGALPVQKGQVSEETFKKVGEVEDVAPGKSKRFAIKLAPGHYVLICNKPGHYSMGMHASLSVVP
jgi:uncharacterized cupredoxin-like copper-binding protein